MTLGQVETQGVALRCVALSVAPRCVVSTQCRLDDHVVVAPVQCVAPRRAGGSPVWRTQCVAPGGGTPGGGGTVASQAACAVAVWSPGGGDPGSGTQVACSEDPGGGVPRCGEHPGSGTQAVYNPGGRGDPGEWQVEVAVRPRCGDPGVVALRCGGTRCVETQWWHPGRWHQAVAHIQVRCETQAVVAQCITSAVVATQVAW
ncbi:hypothetical protein GPJ56_007237 [Histomonas meleagridis]|nr:hypothetical protein GPJ56_007237 [Histomonas meleagridis]